MVRIGVFGDVLEAEFVADERAPGLVPEEIEVRARYEPDDGGAAGGGFADALDAALEVRDVGLTPYSRN